MDLALDKQNGKYKIEIGIMPRGGKNPLIPGRIQVLKSGSAVDGGGDEPMFLCPKCKGLIDTDHTGHGVFVCQHCTTKGACEHLTEGTMFNLTNKGIAELVYKFWKMVEYDADLYLKRFKRPIRTVSHILKHEGHDRAIKEAHKAKSERELVIYPLRNMIKDNVGGADMLKRIETFLSA